MVTATTRTAQMAMKAERMGTEQRAVVGEWFDDHVDTIHRYVARRLGDDLARDVTADTFRTALEHFERFDPDRGQPIAWLYGIATNLVRRHARTEQRRLRNQLRAVDHTDATADASAEVDRRLDAADDAARVVAAVERLSPDDRDVLVLAVWEGLTSAQIAEVVDLPASTVRARLRRIRTNLETATTRSSTKNEHGAPS